MLIYHPIYDVYHGIFRILRLLEVISAKSIEIDRLRILDFYLLFPSLLSKMKFPQSARKFRGMVQGMSGPYESIEDPYKVFIQLEQFQREALGCLVACGLLDSDALKKGIATRTPKALPLDLEDAIKMVNESEHDLIGLLTGPLFDLEFYGNHGLKARTGLMEYRYDS